jgi:transcriptional regulator with XRE-family HTH domain
MNNSTIGIHHGKNVKRMRELMGVKQEALAADLGMSQQSVSLLEQKESIDAATIEKICVILGVPEEMILNMTDEGLVNIFSNTFNDSSATNATFGMTYHFNPLDKLMATIEENKKLYERLLAAEREKVELLMKMVEGKK